MPFIFLGSLNDDRDAVIERNRKGSEPYPVKSDAQAHVSQHLRTGPAQDELKSIDKSRAEVSSLLPQLEQLRRKLAETPSSPPVVRSANDGIPTFGTFKFGYLPGRGLLYSAISHEVVLFLLFLLVTYGLPAARSQKLIVRMNSQDHLIYLPEVGGGSEGQKSPGGGKSAPQEPSAAPARASKGFAYPGAQTILSDPPNPTNAFQTIQRPLLVHPEMIRKLVPLPNIVQMAETRLPSDLVAPEPLLPQHQEIAKPLRVKQDATTHRSAKWKIPVTDAPKLEAKADMPKLPSAEEPLPQAPKVEPQTKQEEEKRQVEQPSPKPIKVTAEKRAEKAEKQVSPPSAAQVARMEMHGKDKEPLLALSPMPLPQAANAKVPAGEARGRFAIAPGGTLNPNSITPGKASVTPSLPAGTGQERLQAANAAADSNSGTGAGHNPSAGGGSGTTKGGSGEGSTGTGTGSGGTAGPGAGGQGSGRGRGSKGNGAASKGGAGNGTGSGAGSGSGTGAFPGITIQGGEEGNNSNTEKSPAFTVEPQTTYGMTIVSTASSGGGLEDFGVFENERIFTVYVPMKRGPDEEDPTWTLQYAVLKDNPATTADGQVSAPTPVAREWPQVPADLEKKYAQSQVVLYAIVDKEGKVSRVTVKQTPDPRVSTPIAEAFQKWLFRPALLNGQPVSVKILLGIPL
ncbi:MAG: hypothetical protein JO356_11485 [Acidobacteria bacterium]|nr:hypothetical protein [Acidobacteriota bacterium]